MKPFVFSVVALLVFIPLEVASQIQGGGFDPNPGRINCVSAPDYAYYREMIALNQDLLEANGKRIASGNTRNGTISFIWPVKAIVPFLVLPDAILETVLFLLFGL